MPSHSLSAIACCLVLTTLITRGDEPPYRPAYSDDLTDMVSHVNEITPIGDIGPVRQIIDLRGFFPFVSASKRHIEWKYKSEWTMLANASSDDFWWFKIPLKTGLSWVYYGPKEIDSVPEADWMSYKITGETRRWPPYRESHKFDDVPVTDLDHLSDEQRAWAQIAFGVSEGGEKLFSALGGATGWGKKFGYESCEPVAIIVTTSSVLVVTSIRYSFFARKGTGQIIVAYEFSRFNNQLLRFYDIRGTNGNVRGIKATFDTIRPIVETIVTIYLETKGKKQRH